MSAIRISVPGRLDFIDLGPGSASTGVLHGELARPVAACQHVDQVEAEARRIAKNARLRAWRAANLDRCRANDRQRAARAREGVQA